MRRPHDDGESNGRGILHPEGMRAVRDLCAGLVHEINNVLGVVIGNAHLAMNGLDDAEAVERHVGEIRDAAEEGRAIMRQLAGLATDRSQDARGTAPISLNEVARQVRSLIGESVSLALCDDEPFAAVDLWLAQTVLSDATRVMSGSPEVREVRIETLSSGPNALMLLDDDGPTPTPDELDALFTPFVRLHGRPRVVLEWTKVAYLASVGGGFVVAQQSPLGGLRIALELPSAAMPVRPRSPRST